MDQSDDCLNGDECKGQRQPSEARNGIAPSVMKVRLASKKSTARQRFQNEGNGQHHYRHACQTITEELKGSHTECFAVSKLRSRDGEELLNVEWHRASVSDDAVI